MGIRIIGGQHFGKGCFKVIAHAKALAYMDIPKRINMNPSQVS